MLLLFCVCIQFIKEKVQIIMCTFKLLYIERDIFRLEMIIHNDFKMQLQIW